MPSKTQMNDDRLVECFVASFDKLDNMTVFKETDPAAWQLSVGNAGQYGFRHWRPKRVTSNKSLLQPIYSQLPAPFPPLYERLVLSFRWAEVDLQVCRLLANPPGPDLGALFQEISGDPKLWKYLREAGYVQFGRGPDMDYDPVCFDTNSSKNSKAYKIVKIDHEEILCNGRVKIVGELAPSFRDLMLLTIDRAEKHGSAKVRVLCAPLRPFLNSMRVAGLLLC
jgi:hypothetical protein